MMKNKFFVSAAILFIASSAFANDSALRISCYNDNVGAKIYVNNEFKGECPLDIFVPAGSLDIRAQKSAGFEYERVFNQKIQVGIDTVKRLEIVLSSPQLTKQAREAREIKAAEEARRVVQGDLQAARQGDLDAMKAMARHYENGDGIDKDSDKAAYWQNKFIETKELREAEADLKAAENGNITAMESLAKRYKTGAGVKKSEADATAWRQKAEVARLAEKKRQAEAREAARLAEQRQEVAAKEAQRLAKVRELEQKKQSFSFLPETSQTMMKSAANDDPIMSTSSPIFTAFGLVSDILSLPTRSSEYSELSNQVAAHPSAWAKPDSLMAKYYREQHREEVVDQTFALVDR